ncbi:spore germination protein [Paenibacillus sacheonensis]|uniref:Spore germination protein n=1 Tax=Paenibacillus sacheonensis TaxID=742054 RepID=A0A7X5BWN6_9BACL|nr:spore germination protein [Paenibacillus sacheonensis]MBM7565439.1 spore germination protein [Paenibacillus sacheonensis]NBC69633.1 spore germination protein [Paenibacillus sacheonensis]
MLNRIEMLFAEARDLTLNRLQNGNLVIEVAYIATLCDESKVSDFILVPFAKQEIPFEDAVKRNPSFKRLDDPAKWAETILHGFVLLQLNGVVYKLDVARIIRNENPQTMVETVIMGPQIALSEDLIDSVNIIRSRYPSEELSVEERTIGTISKTRLLLVFDKHRVDANVLSSIREKLERISDPIFTATGELVRSLGDRYRLFPSMMVTERPDRVCTGIEDGKVILLLQGSMFAIVLPSTFFDFMHAVDDSYDSFWMTRAMIVLRYFAALLTITLPALYVAIMSYNPELFRVQLTFSISGSRSAVPYPSFVEVFIMLFMIESLIEASVRLPKYIGSTATTVGGLILGQAAQQAGLVSSIMIIVTSVVAISNFVIPVNNMSTAIRFLKYPLIIPAIFFGISGVALGMFCYLIYLSDLRSFGKPYFRLFGRTQLQSGDIGQVNQE